MQNSIAKSRLLPCSRKERLVQRLRTFAVDTGMNDATYYNWKKKYTGMTVNELRKLKSMEAENPRL